METPPRVAPDPGQRGSLPLRIAGLVGLLYLFLVAIKLLETGIRLLGANASGDLFAGVENPFAGLAAGILATVLVQSSSVTTSTIVALVGSGTIDLEDAVPMVMGANIGTTITNTLVSMGSVVRRAEFRRAFAAATVHDFFNLMAVAVLLPLQLTTGFLSKSATAIAGVLPVGETGGKMNSPIKSAVKSGAGMVEDALGALGLAGGWLAALLLLVGLVLILVSLTAITKLMKKVIADRAEKALNAALRRSGAIALVAGVLITVAVQSSSITTSLMVPLCASGVLSLENAFPVMLGANIGTTVTAFIASLATDVEGLKIALVHMLFNGIATTAVLAIPRAKRLPLRGARWLAVAAVHNKLWVLGYVAVVFVLIPVLGILLF